MGKKEEIQGSVVPAVPGWPPEASTLGMSACRRQSPPKPARGLSRRCTDTPHFSAPLNASSAPRGPGLHGPRAGHMADPGGVETPPRGLFPRSGLRSGLGRRQARPASWPVRSVFHPPGDLPTGRRCPWDRHRRTKLSAGFSRDVSFAGRGPSDNKSGCSSHGSRVSPGGERGPPARSRVLQAGACGNQFFRHRPRHPGYFRLWDYFMELKLCPSGQFP